MKAVSIGVVSAFGLALVAACGSSEESGSANNAVAAPPGAGSGGAGNLPSEFEVFPPKIFTGYDGSHTFKAPIIAVSSPGEVTWSIADPSIAMIAPDPSDSTELMITALAAGTTTVTATSGSASMTVPLEVVAYTQEQYAAGEQRYKNGDDDNPACIDCHAPGKGPDHTATELDADPDDEVQNTFLSGIDPEGRPIEDNSEYSFLLKGKDHMWQVTEVERLGLLAYLRALEPMGYPEYDEPTTMK